MKDRWRNSVITSFEDRWTQSDAYRLQSELKDPEPSSHDQEAQELVQDVEIFLQNQTHHFEEVKPNEFK